MDGIKFGELEGMEIASTVVSHPSFANDQYSFNAAFTIAFLLRILHSEDQALAANLAYDAIQRALPAMQDVGFQSDLVCDTIQSSTLLMEKYEEFLAPFLELVRGFAPEQGESTTTEWTLIQALQDPERSNCIVVVR